MKPFLLTEIPHDIYNAGFKAKQDIRDALGPKVTDLTVTECFRWDKLPAFRRLLAQIRRIPKGAPLYVQCPLYSFFNPRFMPLLCRAIRRRRCQLVLILHDVDSLRYPDRAPRLRPVEQQLYGLAHRLIVHNVRMQETLHRTHGIPMEKMIPLEIFDYLIPAPAPGAAKSYTPTLFVAGNLSPEKSGYLYRLGHTEGITLHLYGGHYAPQQAGPALHYRGAYPPDTLPTQLEGCFGLVWDGDSTATCAGPTGEYLRINNPHKTSLYLAAGFPVILWEEAALAPFIRENGLGLTVASLDELPALLNTLSPDAYNAMCRRVEECGARLRAGWYIRRAIAAARQSM